MNFKTISPCEDPLIGIVKFFTKRHISHIENYSKFFSDHIEPTFNTMKRIHENYLGAFFQLDQALDGDEWTNDDLIDWLEWRKRNHDSERNLILDFPYELEGSTFYSNVRALSTERDRNIHMEAHAFARNAVRYFDTGNRFVTNTWFTRFLEQLKDESSHQKERREFDPKGTSEPIKIKAISRGYIIKENVHATYSVYLPKQYGRICKSYSRLKRLCKA